MVGRFCSVKDWPIAQAISRPVSEVFLAGVAVSADSCQCVCVCKILIKKKRETVRAWTTVYAVSEINCKKKAQCFEPAVLDGITVS